MSSTTKHAQGILPDDVIRDPASNGWFFFATLRPDLDAAGAQAWLQSLTQAVAELTAVDGKGRCPASAVVALGPSFFGAGAAPRFGIDPAVVPAGLRARPAFPAPLADPAGAATDVAIYVMSPSEAVVAEFERALAATRPALAAVAVERGYQRRDRREHFGFLDGQRNAGGPARQPAVFIECDRLPEEPAWADRGSYLAYMKIRQELEAMAAKPLEEHEQIMGRRKHDGSRLDLPEGTPPRDEGEFTGNPPAAGSHVRKAGPRGAVHDSTLMFRRGVPYLTLQPDGSVDAGLQFASFQATLDAFDTIFARWMINPAFPAARTGPDALFANGLVSIQKAGVYFVPPADDRFIAAGAFDAPKAPPKARKGQIAVRKRATDSNGQPVPAELGGFGFQLFDQTSGQPVGEVFTTNSAGHAMSGKVDVGTTVILREVSVLPGFTPAGDISVALDGAHAVVQVTNTVQSGGSGYGG